MPDASRDRRTRRLLGALALSAAVLIVLIVLFLAGGAMPALWSVGPWRFLTDDGWYPSPGPAGQFGLAPMMISTLLLATGALVLAVPAGVISAVFSRFYAPPPVAWAYRRLIELSAGVPSVVYGLWGLVTLAPLIREARPPGQSLLAGVLILALMVLPTVALMADAALRAVPQRYLLAAAALGLGRWPTVVRVALPAAAGGIAAGALLAAARAVGETMAVLMVTGNVVRVPRSVFDSVRSLPSNIALEMAYATSHHRSALFVTGLVLVILVAALLAAVGRIEARVSRG